MWQFGTFFSIKEGEVKTFYVSGFKYSNLVTKLIGLIFTIHLNYTIKFPYLLFLCIPLALYGLYFITLGRSSYLRVADEFEPSFVQ